MLYFGRIVAVNHIEQDLQRTVIVFVLSLSPSECHFFIFFPLEVCLGRTLSGCSHRCSVCSAGGVAGCA